MVAQINFHMNNSTRKWRFKRYCARQQFFENITKYFKEFINGYGNYSFSKRSIIKGERDPIVGLKKHFIKNGCNVITIDEYNTSKLCSNCYFQTNNQIASTLEDFDYTFKRNNNEKKTRWAKILYCAACHTTIDRDVNASINMFNLLKRQEDMIERPEAFCRGN